MTRRRGSGALLALAAAALLVGPSCRREPPAPGGAAHLDRLRVGVLPQLSYAPLAIARDEGYFRDEGIDAELVEMRHQEGYTAIGKGLVDVFAGPVNPGFFNLIARGSRVRIVADKGFIDEHETCPSYSLLIRKGIAPIPAGIDAARIRGWKFSFSRYTQWELVIETMLERRGLQLADIRQSYVPSTIAGEALADGTIDVVIGAEPQQTLLLEAGAAEVWIPFSRIIPNAQLSVLYYGSRLLDQRPDLGRRFMRAYLRGAREYRNGMTDRNVAVIARFTNLDAALVRKMCWPAVREDGEVDTASIDDFVRWGARKGYIDRVISPSDYWDPQFVQAARTP